jgi:hypothetical protein
MLDISLNPTGTGAGWSFSFDGVPPAEVSGSLSRCVVVWAVRVDDRQKVRLATGKELNDLPGRARFFIGDTAQERQACWGTFKWFEGVQSEPYVPESYDVDMYVSRAFFNRLESLVAARTIPKLTVSVGGDRDDDEAAPEDRGAIKFGWEPDGAGLEWDNIKHPRLEVRWCRFDVDVGLPPSPDDEDLPDQSLASPTKADLRGILETVAKATQKIERLLAPLWLIAALLALLVFLRR